MKNINVLVMSSTFPASDTDPVPSFVKDQLIYLKKLYPELHISILAPYDYRSNTHLFTKHKYYDEYRFHYFWPRRFEKLAGRGIMPQLKKNPIFFLLIPFLFIGEFLATRRLVRRLHPDYIYAHWFTPQGIVASMVAKSAKIPVVITTHASDVAVWSKVPLGGIIVRRYIRSAKAITAVSQRTLLKLRKFFSDTQWLDIAPRVEIIPMGVNFFLSPKEINESPGQSILFIGRLVEKKGIHYLLPAFAKVAQIFPHATLTIAGDGPMLAELQHQTKKLGLSKQQVNFPGYVSGEDKKNLIKESDLFVVPSIETNSGDSEGLPVSLMEGMAGGCICVATYESGADEIITDGEDGFLVEQKNVEAIVWALKKSLELNKKDRNIMQENSIKTARKFSWDKIAKEHYEFLFKNK